MPAILPTFKLTGTGGTVDFSRKHGPEELRRPSQTVPYEVRRCLSDGNNPGRVYLLHDVYGLPGQTMETSHRIITSAQDTLLSAWNQSKETLVYQDSKGTCPVVITRYEARPRNVRWRWETQFVVDALELFFVEDD